MPAPTNDITRLLVEWHEGRQEALDRLVPLVYSELRRMAQGYLQGERADHTLQPTALVHEAYLRLVDQKRVQWQNRAQFFGLAAQFMRRILVDHARARAAEKRGSGVTKVTLVEDITPEQAGRDVDVLALDDALVRLTALDAQQARVVELRFFGGLTVPETAAVLEISPATVKREWRSARAWLFRELRGV